MAAHAGKVLAVGRHFDGAMGWVGDLEPYYRRLDAKHLWYDAADRGGRSTTATATGASTPTSARSWSSSGQTVKAGQFLGYEGATGRATGCHVHYGLFSPLRDATFEIDPGVVKRMKVPRLQTARIDPLLVLPDRNAPPGLVRVPGDRPAALALISAPRAAVAAGDEPVGPGSSRARPRAGSARRRGPRGPAGPVGRGGIAGPRVDLGQVDRDAARLGRRRAPRSAVVGTAAGLVLGAELGLGAPRRPAQQDRPPRRRRSAARDRPVAGSRIDRRATRRVPSGPPGGAARTRRGRRRRTGASAGEPSPKIARIGRPEDVAQVEVDRPHGAVEVDLLVHEPARGQEHLERPEPGLVEGQAARPR